MLLLIPAISFADSTVNASSDSGSSVNPSGVTIVPTGIIQTFTFNVDNGYLLGGVTLDGQSLGKISSYDFTGINNDPTTHSLSVSSVASGGSMPYCSGPEAPGWIEGIPGGGCGGTATHVQAGSEGCPFWFPAGCMKE